MREANQIEISDLRHKLQLEKADKIRELADKERQKVQATDKLRDDMLKEIREMHIKYVSLKTEQLDTTTRLTILQNHQLTSELQYQSKQTEKLIYKEEDMQQKLKQLNQEVAVHKQVEEELAKRAHFSKGIIKKLTDRVSELEEELQRLKSDKGDKQLICSKLNTQTSKYVVENSEDEHCKQVMYELEKQLGITEKGYTQAQAKLQTMGKEYESVSKKLKKYENSTNQLIKMMITFSQEIISKCSAECQE